MPMRFETVISIVLILPITNRPQLTNDKVNNTVSESLLGAFSIHFTLWQCAIWYTILNKWKFGSSQKATTGDDKLLWEDSRLAVVEVGWSDGIAVEFTRLVVKDGTVAVQIYCGRAWFGLYNSGGKGCWIFGIGYPGKGSGLRQFLLVFY